MVAAACDGRLATAEPPVPPAVLADAEMRVSAPSGIACASCGARTAATPSAAGPAARPATLPPLRDASWLEPLPMPAGRAAFVSVPLGATEPRPVVVGVHGAGDRAEWACGGYRAATHAYPFIVCPQGLPDGSGAKFATSPPPRLLDDIEAALGALSRRFPRYIAGGPIVYAGFSLGAIHGASVVSQHAAQFPLALLVEGGYTQWPVERAASFVRDGGQRVALVCGQSACRRLFANAKRTFDRVGADCRVFDTGTGRHNLDGEMMRELTNVFRWLTADDPRWHAFAAAAAEP